MRAGAQRGMGCIAAELMSPSACEGKEKIRSQATADPARQDRRQR